MKEKIVLKNEGNRLNVIGDHQQIKLSGKDTNEQYVFIVQDNPPGTQLPPHIHEKEDEVYNILEGEVEFTADGKTSLLKSGDSIFLPHNQAHYWKVVGSTNAKMHLSIFPAGIERMFEELDKLPAGPPDISKVVEICGRYGVRIL